MGFHLSDDEYIKEINVKEDLVELVLYIDTIHAPCIVGREKKYEIFKFLVTNKPPHSKGTKVIQCKVWGKDIPLFRPKIKEGTIIHINGASAIPVSPDWNRGNVLFELVLKEHTEVTVIEDIADVTMECNEAEAIPIELPDLADYVNKCVSFKGYIKTNFVPQYNRPSVPYACAALADKGYKIQVHVNNFEKDEDITVGCKLHVTGIVKEELDKYGVNKMYVYVETSNLIHLLKDAERKSSQELILNNKTPQKRTLEMENSTENLKKQKDDKQEKKNNERGNDKSGSFVLSDIKKTL